MPISRIDMYYDIKLQYYNYFSSQAFTISYCAESMLEESILTPSLMIISFRWTPLTFRRRRHFFRGLEVASKYVTLGHA